MTGAYPHRPQDRGFDEVFMHGGGGIGQLEDYYGNSHYDPTFVHNGEVVHTEGYSTDVLFDRAMDWIDKQAGKPFFCLLSTPAVHAPHQGPKDANGRNTGLHGMIENFDMNVGRMMETLDRLELSESTVLIYASDQGSRYRGAPSGRENVGIAHDASHHVPFMVRLPGGRPRIDRNLTGMIDFVPTVLDLCGVEAPDNLDGVSLKPLLFGDGDAYPGDRTMIVQCPRERDARKWKNVSVKMGNWRLVSGKKLYDTRTDPKQKQNVAEAHPEIVQRLSRVYEDFWSSLPDQSQTLSHHLVGAGECPEVALNGMDWYKGAQPWTTGAMEGAPQKRRNQNGAWAVTIARKGTYRFELRRFPREANKPIGLSRARIKIGNLAEEKGFEKNATSVSFDLDLEPGDYDLQTWLGAEPGSAMNYGALFVYVSRSGSEL
jgi:hypothetical protein